MPMIIKDDWGGLVQLLIIVLFVVGGLIVKGLSKLFGNSDEKQKQKRPRGGPAQGGKSPEEALEDFFQQAKRKQREAPQAPAAGAGQQAQTLDDFFQPAGTAGSTPAASPPVAMAVPVARPLSPQQRPKVKRVRTSRSDPAASNASSPYNVEAVARARAAISKAGRRQRSKPSVVEQGEAAMLGTGTSLGHLGPSELAQAVIYAEILGKPRAVSPYSGPPAAG
jgi:hypothetical protein